MLAFAEIQECVSVGFLAFTKWPRVVLRVKMIDRYIERNNNEYKREDMLGTVKWDHEREKWMRE